MTALLFSLSALSIVACKGAEVEDTAFERLDADNDSYFDDEDCDDTNAAVYPGAPEYCDGVDNNCDGETEGARGWPGVLLGLRRRWLWRRG